MAQGLPVSNVVNVDVIMRRVQHQGEILVHYSFSARPHHSGK